MISPFVISKNVLIVGVEVNSVDQKIERWHHDLMQRWKVLSISFFWYLKLWFPAWFGIQILLSWIGSFPIVVAFEWTVQSMFAPLQKLFTNEEATMFCKRNLTALIAKNKIAGQRKKRIDGCQEIQSNHDTFPWCRCGSTPCSSCARADACSCLCLTLQRARSINFFVEWKRRERQWVKWRLGRTSGTLSSSTWFGKHFRSTGCQGCLRTWWRGGKT
jgi:hypothetical protein